ncbi:MAG: 1-acyl-sn-glycerol-3-phosphate acyltransferase [Marinilabiliales bacterium]|nr:1-acyl-sn-glycerol-3-phosphate acyltransferase [Marinilabiliales bacterium]
MKSIVLKEIIAAKNSKLANRIPGFVYGLLNRLLHIREINEIMDRYGEDRGSAFIRKVLDYCEVRFDYKGTELLDPHGRYILASNHPLGGFDGLILLESSHRFLGPTRTLARDELSKIPQLAELFIPINKFGNQRNSAQAIHEAYASDDQIMIFPAGLASRRKKGVIADLQWNKHFIQKATEYQRDVVPVFISGQNSSFFYWFANFRKFIGLKINLEMFLLPHEMFRQRGGQFTITFGKPIPWQTFDKSKSQSEWAESVKTVVYEMRKNK